MDTPVIDLTAAPDSPGGGGGGRGAASSSSSSSSSQDAPHVATSLTRSSQRNTARNATATATATASGSSSNASASASASASTSVRPPRRVPYPMAHAPNTPIDLTDDDIEYLGEHRLHLPDQPHAHGNDTRPVSGDNYSLMDRLRDVAGMPFSRHASASTSNNNRVIEEDPIRYGLTGGAGPGPAAVAAANARARRHATTSNRSTPPNNAVNDPPAGLNARRNRQRAQNAHNANNNHNNHNAGNDPNAYYYRRVQPPAPPGGAAAERRLRPPRAGRRQREVYQGLIPGGNGWEDDYDPEEDEALYHYMNGGHDDADYGEDIEFQPHLHANLGGLLAGRIGGGGGANRGALQGIMQLLGFGNHMLNAQPVNHVPHFNHANPPRRKVKAYSVRQSHPNFNKKKDGKDGFERDIVPPPEVEEEEEQAPEQPAQVPDEVKPQPVVENGIVEIESKEDTKLQSQEENSGSFPRINKGKGRALEVDTAIHPTSSHDDIPILDLANGSPNTSTSTSASSTLFSGMLSNSTRTTSPEHQSTDSNTAAPKVGQVTVKAKTRIIRAPVCTSCSAPLFLNQSSKGRPYVLLCGHVICKACLDAATLRLKRWTMDEPELIQDDDDDAVSAKKSGELYVGRGSDSADDRESSLPPVPTDRTAWRGARLKESFEEVDRSRSATIAETAGTSTSRGAASTSKAAKDRKGKKKAVAGAGAGSSATAAAPASTSSSGQAVNAPSSSSTSTRPPRRSARRPDYAELDGDEEGQPDGSYVPRSTRDGMDEDDDAAVDNQVNASNEEDDDESTLRSLVRKNTKDGLKGKDVSTNGTGEDDDGADRAESSQDPDYAAKSKGKGRIKIVMNGVSSKAEDNATEDVGSSNGTAAPTGKRKRGSDKAGVDASGKSTTSTKAKKQKIEKPPLIDVHWLTCPVNGCKGGTDLSKPIGSREGAWELFV